jgi:integrase
MSVYRDKARGRFIFEFDRYIQGERVRARKLLPKLWSQAQADAFDRQESARLYAIATSVERADHLIEDAVARYLKGRVPHLKHGREVVGELALIFWAYQGRPLTALAEVCKAYAMKSGDLAPATVRKRIRYLTAACRWAWKNCAMGEADPAARVVVPTVKNERQVYIDRRKMLQLARACRHRPTRAAIRIGWYSGMRLSEIERAERDFEAGVFVLRDTKNGEPRIVPMHPRVRGCARIPLPTRYITSYHFRAARAAVKMNWLHFHDLRHSTASALIQEGVDVYTVGAILGHKSTASTRRYAHLSTTKATEAIGRLGQKIPHQVIAKKAA